MKVSSTQTLNFIYFRDRQSSHPSTSNNTIRRIFGFDLNSNKHFVFMKLVDVCVNKGIFYNDWTSTISSSQLQFTPSSNMRKGLFWNRLSIFVTQIDSVSAVMQFFFIELWRKIDFNLNTVWKNVFSFR